MNSKKNYEKSREILLQTLENDSSKIHELIEKNDIKALIQNFDIYQEELRHQNDELIEKEKEIQRQAQIHISLFNEAPIVYLEIDNKSSIIHFNKKAVEFFGKYTSLSTHHIKFNIFIDSESFKEYNEMLFNINSEKLDYIQKEIIFKIKNKRYYGITSISKNSYNDNYLVTIKDITKEKDQQKLIFTQSKVAAVGEMLNNISHQWRQPLSVIAMHAANLKLDLGLSKDLNYEEIISCTNDVLEQTDYLTKTIDDFRNFFGDNDNIPKKTNLKDLLEKMYSLIEASFKDKHIKCLFNLEEEIIVTINEAQLIQSLINICNNAKDALVQMIEDTDKRYFSINLYKENEYVLISFYDSAGGIDSSFIDKVFDPYFTTKGPEIGTGIGLYMTHEIITKQLQGLLEVKNINFKYNNEQFKGANFIIKLKL